jgi:dihydroorotate dehydrogenase electron transfer subunit
MHDSICKVMVQRKLTDSYHLLELHAPEVARTARPGQFIHMRVAGLEETALRRPFSIFRVRGETLSLIYKTVGRGTRHLARLRAGDDVGIIGPLGNGFPLNEAAGRLPLLIAGGYGVAPLSFLASRMAVKGVLLAGGRTADDLLCLDDFTALGWEVQTATQDGSHGESGLVTVLLDRWLAAHAADGVELYVCGPDGLLRAVAERAARAGCRAWLSLDKHMVCGVGACLACVQKLRRADGSVWMGRVCHDGPVFEAAEVVWDGV